MGENGIKKVIPAYLYLVSVRRREGPPERWVTRVRVRAGLGLECYIRVRFSFTDANLGLIWDHWKWNRDGKVDRAAVWWTLTMADRNLNSNSKVSNSDPNRNPELSLAARYSGVSNFRRYFYGIWYLRHPLTSTKNFTEIAPRGTPPSGELNARGVAKYSDFGPIEGYISETVQCSR